MADVDGAPKGASAELEVLKLQALVRQLERQNEQLRTRANAPANGRPGGPRRATSPLCSRGAAAAATSRGDGRASCPCAAEPFAYFQPSSEGSVAADAAADASTLLDEVDVLDLSVLLPIRDPESWLYASPKAKPRGAGVLGPLQWCRQVLDHLGPDAELAKMTLCHRLDQAKRRRGVSSVRPYSCIEGLSTLSCPVLPYTKATAPAEPPGRSFLRPPLPPGPGVGLSDRAPSFLSNSSLRSLGRRHAAVTPQSSLDSEAGVSELEDDSISMSYKLKDMTDVEVMARLQEESLRQDYASTSATAGRQSSSLSLHSLRRSVMDLEEEDEEEDEDEEEEEGYDRLPPPQPRLFRAGSAPRGGLPHSHTFSSIRDCRRGPANPPFSLGGGLAQYSVASGLSSDAHAAYRNGTDKLRRSMPNLIRAPSMPGVPGTPCLASSPVNPPSLGPSASPAISSLRSSQSFDSSSGLSRLQYSILPPGQLGQRVQSVGNFLGTPRQPLKATAYVSPTVQQGPATTSVPTSVSLHSVTGSAALPQPLKPCGGPALQAPKAGAGQPAAPRSSLPRRASFVGASEVPRPTKIAQPTRSLLAPKSLAALSALRDGSWKDGCY